MKQKEIINVNNLPENIIKPNCFFPRIVPLMTYQDSKQSVFEILNVTCKSRLCLDPKCPLKDIVNLK